MSDTKFCLILLLWNFAVNRYTKYLRIGMRSSYKNALDFYKFKRQRNYCLSAGTYKKYFLHENVQKGTGTHTPFYAKRLGRANDYHRLVLKLKKRGYTILLSHQNFVLWAGICCVSGSRHMIGNAIINGIISGYGWMIKANAFLTNTNTIVRLQIIQEFFELSPVLLC